MLYVVAKGVLTPLLRLGFRVHTEGVDGVPADGPVILASNHVSFCDSIFIPLVVPRQLTFLAKAEYFDQPVTGVVLRSLGIIPIKREGGNASQRALASAIEILHDGGVLAIYPEGTRSPDGRLHKGHTGVARLALQTGATVVPVWLRGTAEVQPIGSRWMRPGKPVDITMGEPLQWPGRAGDISDPVALRKVTDEIMTAIGALGGQPPLDEYANRRKASA
ncbi:MAG: 1-acyl-sn-glycerol-3-phosphate acyltransferase [Acidimicrobiaceae bacterium]|nr:1-acyl-sn-glycerol-3-phosphate acyltransferase [Acidimicrobiaceae bacterium]